MLISVSLAHLQLGPAVLAHSALGSDLHVVPPSSHSARPKAGLRIETSIKCAKPHVRFNC